MAGLATGVPLGLLHLLDLEQYLAFAAFGSMTTLYGRHTVYAVRAPLVAVAGTLQVLGVGLGTATAAWSDDRWVFVAVVAVFAGAAKLLSDAVRLGPPAGLMSVFAIAVCIELPVDGSVVAPAVLVAALSASWAWLLAMSGWFIRRSGPERTAVARALEGAARRVRATGTDAEPEVRHQAALAMQRAWAAVGAAPAASRTTTRLESLCGYAEHVVRSARVAALADAAMPVLEADRLDGLARDLRRLGPVPEEPPGLLPLLSKDGELEGVRVERSFDDHHLWRRPSTRWGASLRELRPGSPYLPLALRVLVAAALSGALAHLLHLGHVGWAAVSAVAVLQAVNRTHTMQRSIQRGVGTGAGLLLGVASLAFAPGLDTTIVLVTVLSVLAELVVMINYALALVFATPLALLLAHVGDRSGDPLVLATDRLVDTVVGVVVAIGCAVLVRNRRFAGELVRAMARCREAIAYATDLDAGAELEGRLATARTLAARLHALREAHAAAAGEPWPEDLDTESILNLERAGHLQLARLSR